MSAWLERLRTLSLDLYASAEISKISESREGDPLEGGFGDFGDFSTGTCLEMALGAIHVDDVVWLPRLNRWVGRTSPKLTEAVRKAAAEGK